MNSILLEAGSPLELGTDSPRLTFGEDEHPAGTWRGMRRLELDGRSAFELSFWCGTCPFLFERLEGAVTTMSPADLRERMNDGLDDIDPEVLDLVSQLLPRGEFLPLLLVVRPRLITPMQKGDYFAEDQVRTWGVSGFWGLPEYPRTPYYRVGTRDISRSARLFEFVVPMVPPSWNDHAEVVEQGRRLAISPMSTAIALSVFDVCQPAVTTGASEEGLAHWGVAHFLLDGHHKMQAAAETECSVRLLALITVDHGLASREAVLELPRILASP